MDENDFAATVFQLRIHRLAKHFHLVFQNILGFKTGRRVEQFIDVEVHFKYLVLPYLFPLAQRHRQSSLPAAVGLFRFVGHGFMHFGGFHKDRAHGFVVAHQVEAERRGGEIFGGRKGVLTEEFRAIDAQPNIQRCFRQEGFLGL